MGKIKTKVGFGEKVREIEVDVPEGDAEPWGADAKLSVVGTDVIRVDAAAKASGRAKYTYDVKPSDLLHAFVLHAPYGAARLKKIDTSAAEKMPGVKGVHRFKKQGDPILYHGDEILAIAAETAEQAEDALKAVAIEYERKPVVTTIPTAMKDGAPQVFDGKPNVSRGRSQGRDPSDAIKGADKVVEATYETQVQTHSSLEPHGTVAKFEADGSLTVWCSTQATFGIRGQAAGAAGLRGGKVRVLAEFVGGGFGSKFGLHPSGQAAVALAKQTGRPVKCMMTREGEHTTGGNRPSSIQKMRGGVGNDGVMRGLSVEIYGSGGVGGGGGVPNPMIYNFGVSQKSESGVFINGGPAAAFRAPGHPQAAFAVDSFLDECAHAIDMDPLEFRRKNCADEVYNAQWDLGAKLIGWERRPKKPGTEGAGPLKRGFGMASTRWGQIGREGSRVDVVVGSDGTVEAHNGAQDIGTGTKTILATIVAEELGIKTSQVVVKMGDTDLPPGPGSGGSTTAPSVGPAARNAGVAAKNALAKAAAAKLGCEAKDVTFANAMLSGGGKSLTFEEACKLLGEERARFSGDRAKNYGTYRGGVAGCQFAEVEVDIETGVIRPIKIVAVQDAGRVISKLTFESQVLGGVIQGISYALHEDRMLDRNSGTQVNADFLNYKISGAADMPEIVPVAFSVANAGNNCGMAGLGEPPTIPTAAAIANAVFNATGVRVRTLPMTPARMLAALGRKDW